VITAMLTDTSDESDTDEMLDSLRAIGLLSMHSCSAVLSFVCFLNPAALTFVIFSPFSQTTASRKTELLKN